MKIKLPADCGNSPRITIVGDFITCWAQGDMAAVGQWLTEDATWSLVGEGTYIGQDALDHVRPSAAPESVEVITIITHGRLASCDGFLETGSARMYFSHVFRFASTTKAAKIKDARSYYIEQLTQ